MKNRILVIEDDPAIAELICMNLEAAGYETCTCDDGIAAEQYLTAQKAHSADLALVDLMLPGKDGFELIEVLKQYKIPVIFLTAKADITSKVRGLKLGAEDYIVKPFEILELLVRIEKVLERAGKSTSMLISGDLQMDLNRRRVYENGNKIALKPMEFNLLAVFLKNRNIVLGRDRLLDLVWGSDYYGETRTVDVHVARLRKKIKICQAIRTIPKAGYLYEED